MEAADPGIEKGKRPKRSDENLISPILEEAGKHYAGITPLSRSLGLSLSLSFSLTGQHTDGHDLRDYGNENTVILRTMTKLPVVRRLIAWKPARAERTKIKFASVHVIDPICSRIFTAAFSHSQWTTTSTGMTVIVGRTNGRSRYEIREKFSNYDFGRRALHHRKSQWVTSGRVIIAPRCATGITAEATALVRALLIASGLAT